MNFTLKISGSYACDHFKNVTKHLCSHHSLFCIAHTFSVSLCAKVDWCALNVENLLTGPEIFSSQLERRALISSWSIFVTCVSWEIEMWHVFFYSISTVFRKKCKAVRCLFSPQPPLRPCDIVLGTTGQPLTTTQWFSVWRTVCGELRVLLF